MMEVLNKCKKCGGTLIAQDDGLTGKCEYCKAILPLPKAKDEKLQNILNRANDFRMSNDFDRAIIEYEDALRLDETEPDLHWGIFLSRYGVEYVKDPYTFTYKPTIHRISSVSVFDDPDYNAAIKYSEPTNLIKYKQQAEEVEAVMKEFLAISSGQEQYDVFICYKEADDITRLRTEDSALAHELYAELTASGFKTFFAPKSLTGGLFEPKIYAAIVSAKAMIVLGTKEENYNAVWVKNEWTRFAELIDHGEDKIIIPVYKGISADNLPPRLAKYQALNISDIGFLPRLIEMISEKINNQKSFVENKHTDAENAFLERGFLALEDGDFTRATQFFENALNQNPHSSRAYFGCLMSELKIRDSKHIITSPKKLKEYPNFEKAVRFADGKFKTELLKYEKDVADNLDEADYLQAIKQKESGLYKEAMEIFGQIEYFKNSKEFREQCENSIGELKKQISVLQNDISLKEKEQKRRGKIVLLKMLSVLVGILIAAVLYYIVHGYFIPSGALDFFMEVKVNIPYAFLDVIINAFLAVFFGLLALFVGFILPGVIGILFIYIVFLVMGKKDHKKEKKIESLKEQLSKLEERV